MWHSAIDDARESRGWKVGREEQMEFKLEKMNKEKRKWELRTFG
jgi:hypothetical protein